MKKEFEKPNIHFHDSKCEWKPWKIGDFLTEKYRPIIIEDEKEYQLITVKRRNEGIVSRGYLKGKNILVKNYFEVERGDFIISKRQIIHGASGIVPQILHGAVVSNEYLVAISNEIISAEYLALISKLPEMYKQYFLSSFGVDLEKMVFDVKDWKKRRVTIPGINEQKRITGFFQNLDKLIVEHQQKHTKMKTLKQAMLDKMFPKKGQLVPEIRFKGYIDEWLPFAFKSLADLKRGLTYSPSYLTNNTGVKVLRSSNIRDGQFIQKDDDVYVKEEAINIDFIKEHDILITAANGSSKLVGKHAIINKLDCKAVHGGFMLLASTKYPFFLNAYMDTEWYNKFVNQYTAGGGGSIGNLNKKELEEQIVLAPTEDERNRIGEYFKNLDDIIRNHEQQLAKLQNIRRAFLVKMFI
jgi:type I restriction enzyme S subunit